MTHTQVFIQTLQLIFLITAGMNQMNTVGLFSKIKLYVVSLNLDFNNLIFCILNGFFKIRKTTFNTHQ